MNYSCSVFTVTDFETGSLILLYMTRTSHLMYVLRNFGTVEKQ